MKQSGIDSRKPVDLSHPDGLTLLALTGVFLLIPLLPVTAFNTIQQLRRLGWTETPGTIVSSIYSPGRGRFVPSQSKVVYKYRVDGVEYVGQTWSMSVLSRVLVNSAVRNYRDGDRAWVYHHPRNPANSVLQVSLLPLDWALIGVTAVFIALGVVWLTTRRPVRGAGRDSIERTWPGSVLQLTELRRTGAVRLSRDQAAGEFDAK